MNRNIILINRFFYPDHSATSQLLTDLAFYLVEEEYSVSVICSHQVYDNSADLLSTYELKFGVNIYRIKTSNFGRHWLPGRVIDYASYFVGMSWKLFRLLRAGDVVVAKTDPPLMSIFTVFIAKIKRAAHISWTQDLFPEVAVAIGIKGIPSFIISFLQYLRNCSLRHSDKVVVIGELMKNRLSNAGINEGLIDIIPNWSDEKNITPVERDLNPLRKHWGLERKFLIGYSGNMGRVHEFDTIINAANRLKHSVDMHFIFIGDGPQKNKIESKIKALSLSNVSFFPYQPYESLSNSLSLPDVHLISLKPEAEGYCVPSKYYGILASGRPSIFVGDKKGEISQLLQMDRSGYQVDCGDDTALAETIILLYNNREDLNRLGRNSRYSFINKYEKNITLKKWGLLVQNTLKPN